MTPVSKKWNWPSLATPTNSILSSLSNNTKVNSKLEAIEDMVQNISNAVKTRSAKLEERIEHLGKSYAEAAKTNADSVRKSRDVSSKCKGVIRPTY